MELLSQTIYSPGLLACKISDGQHSVMREVWGRLVIAYQSIWEQGQCSSACSCRG